MSCAQVSQLGVHMKANDIQIVKLLSVDDVYYETFEQHERLEHTWHAFSAAEAQNLWANGYVLMCVRANKRFIDPYLESLFPLETIYVKKLDTLLQKTRFAEHATDVERYNVAYLFVKLLDNEAMRRNMTFQASACTEVSGCEETDKTFLQAKRQDVVQFLQLLNAQLFFERLVEELCGTSSLS